MTRATRRFRPQATPLEAKLLLSVAATPPAEPAEMTTLEVRTGTAPATAITSTVAGRYSATEDNRIADAPLHVRINGAGAVDGLGRAKLAGALDLGGFRITGAQDVTGTLVLANAHGTVKLRVAGSGGFNEVPNGQFVTDVTVVRGTGAYRGFQRSGTATFDFGANQVRSVTTPSPIGGPATVTLALKPLVK